jgi:tetratricopeptide (TPR) repeat protein
VRSIQRIVSISTLVIITSATFSVAADTQASDEAAVVANAAIAQLAGWENQEARKTLQAKKGKFGNTPEFKTAWALLEAQEAVESGKKSINPSVTTMSQMAKSTANDFMASYWEAELLYLQSKNNEALAAWKTASAQAQKAVKADPNDATAQFYLGAALVRQKKFDPALKALRLAVRGGFDEAMVNYQIGFIYLFQQKWNDARKAFDLGLEVNPRFAPMYFWRGMAWDKLGKKDNYLLDLDRYVKLAPNGPEAAKARAVLKSMGG